jgi:hypothetical protein
VQEANDGVGFQGNLLCAEAGFQWQEDQRSDPRTRVGRGAEDQARQGERHPLRARLFTGPALPACQGDRRRRAHNDHKGN